MKKREWRWMKEVKRSFKGFSESTSSNVEPEFEETTAQAANDPKLSTNFFLKRLLKITSPSSVACASLLNSVACFKLRETSIAYMKAPSCLKEYEVPSSSL